MFSQKLLNNISIFFLVIESITWIIYVFISNAGVNYKTLIIIFSLSRLLTYSLFFLKLGNDWILLPFLFQIILQFEVLFNFHFNEQTVLSIVISFTANQQLIYFAKYQKIQKQQLLVVSFNGYIAIRLILLSVLDTINIVSCIQMPVLCIYLITSQLAIFQNDQKNQQLIEYFQQFFQQPNILEKSVAIFQKNEDQCSRRQLEITPTSNRKILLQMQTPYLEKLDKGDRISSDKNSLVQKNNLANSINISQQLPKKEEDQSLLQSLTDLSPSGLVMIDANHKPILHNDKVLKILECTQDQLDNQMDKIFNTQRILPQQYQNKGVQFRKKDIRFSLSLDDLNISYVTQDYINRILYYHHKYEGVDYLELLLNPQNENNQEILDEGKLRSKQQSKSQNVVISLCDLQQSSEKSNVVFKITLIVKGIEKKLMLTIVQGKIKKQNNQILEISSERNSNTKENMIIVFFQDITNFSNLKEIEEKIIYQNDILQSFSHELKTPLNGSLNLLREVIKIADKNLNETYLVPAYSCNIQLNYQIKNIFDYAQIQKKELDYNFTHFYLREIVSEIIKIYQCLCDWKNITLSYDVSPDIMNKDIVSDKDRILQVLVNLMSNAVKFTNENGKIELMIEKANLDDTVFEFSVTDNGQGMNSQKIQLLQHFLEKENRVEKKIQDYVDINKEHHGLGLRISNKLISGLGPSYLTNKLEIQQTETLQGVCFKFIVEDKLKQIQLQKSPENRQFEPSIGWKVYTSDMDHPICEDKYSRLSQAKTTHTLIDLKSTFDKIKKMCKKCKKILIVDDEPFNHLSLKLMLQKEGYQVDQVYNGLDAVRAVERKYQQECCSEKQYRLIFMDIQMPILNGFEASQEIDKFLKDKLKDKYKKCIVFFSAYDTEQNVGIAEQMGFSFLPKPVDIKKLQQVIRKYIIEWDKNPASFIMQNSFQ